MAHSEPQDKQIPEDQAQDRATPQEEVPQDAWDNFDDLLDKALGTEKEEPPAQQAG